MQRENYGCASKALKLQTVRYVGMPTDQSSWDILIGGKTQREGLQVLCISKPPTAPWESWSSRLFDNEQPNSPATPSEDYSPTYFMEASQLPAEAYRCSEAYTQEAFIDVESEYCSEHDADKQDLHYRLLVGGLRSGRKRATNRPGSRKQIGKQAKLTRKPSKTRYAFQSMESSRSAIQQEASTRNDHSELSCIVYANFLQLKDCMPLQFLKDLQCCRASSHTGAAAVPHRRRLFSPTSTTSNFRQYAFKPTTSHSNSSCTSITLVPGNAFEPTALSNRDHILSSTSCCCPASSYVWCRSPAI